MPGASVRALTVAMGVQDRATKIVGDLKGQIDKINGKVVQSHLRANDSASKPIKNVAKCLEQADRAAYQAFKSLGHFETGATASARAAAKMEDSLKRVNTSIKGYSANLETAKKNTQHLQDLQGTFASVAAVSGAGFILSTKAAAEYDRSLTDIRNTLMDVNKSQKYISWVENGQAMNKGDRATLARSYSKYSKDVVGLSDEEIIRMLDLSSWQANILNVGAEELAMGMKGVFKGRPEEIFEKLGVMISQEEITAGMEEVKRTSAPGEWEGKEKELKGMVATRILLKRLEQRKAEADEAGGPEIENLNRLDDSITDIRINVGKTFLPLVEALSKGAAVAAKFTEKFPRATFFGAVAMALAFLASTFALFIGMAAPGIIALHGMAAGMSLGAVATGAMSAAMGILNAVMAMNPIFLVAAALVGIAAILVYVNKKTGILTKAWGELNELWSSLKEGDVGKIGKKAATMAFKLVFPPAMLYAILKHVPGMANIMDRVEVKIGGILNHLKDFKDRAVDSLKNLIPGWLKNIWDRLRDIVIRIKEALITALGGLIPDEVKTSLEAIAAVKEGQAAGVGARAASVRSWGIHRKSDDGYQVARFTPAKGLGMDQMARAASLMGDRSYLTWPELMALSAEDQALFGWGGGVSEMTRKQMLKAGWSESNLEAYDKFLRRVGGGRATAEDVAGANTDYTKTDAGNDLLGGVAGAVVDVASAPFDQAEEHFSETGAEQQRQRTEAREAEQNTLEFLGAKIPTGGAPASVDAIEFAGRQIPVYNQADLRGTGWGTNVRINGSGQAVMEADIDSLPHKQKLEFQQTYGFTQFVPKLDRGGGVEETGGAVVHAGEEFSPADVVHRTTAAERLLDRLESTGILPSAGSGDTINNNNVTVHVTVNGVKESFSKFDLARIISQQVKRELGQFKT